MLVRFNIIEQEVVSNNIMLTICYFKIAYSSVVFTDNYLLIYTYSGFLGEIFIGLYYTWII